MIISIILTCLFVAYGGWWLWRLLREKEKANEKKEDIAI